MSETIDVDEVRRRLSRRPRHISYADIKEQTNISISWLTKFACNRLDAPRLDMVIRLSSALDHIHNV